MEIWTKFCRVVSISELTTYANFGDDQIRGLSMVGVKLCHSPQTSILVLTL